MRIYNSLSRKIEEFVPLEEGKAGVYCCGPTVYDYASIGNWRTNFLADVLVRVLKYLDYEVKFVMNITDVGHLTGDNLGDADTGEDKLEKASKREQKTAREIADFYTKDFLTTYKKLNLTEPDKFTKATEYIAEQIELLKKIEEKGFTYRIDDGVYFDVKKYEKSGFDYGQLSTLDQIKEGARVEINEQKKDSRDFALWKFSKKGEKRQMEWDSPWGKGFPGWHLECSAMSMKHLGEQFDIHVGGEDLRSTHHPNEIAQSQAATGKKPYVKYWVHGAFLQVDGGRMGKSLGNAYTIKDLEKRGFEALDLRYFYLSGHYRKPLNFTFKALESAKEGYERLKSITSGWAGKKGRTVVSEEKIGKIEDFNKRFLQAIKDDLNMPQAMAVVWEMVKSNIPEQDKGDFILDWDQVLGLNLGIKGEEIEIPEEIKLLAGKRLKLRKQEKWNEADKVRQEIEAKGFQVEDVAEGYKIKAK